MASCNFLWNRYKQSAKKRGRVFELSKEYFRELTSSDCHYCGTFPRSWVKGNDSTGGYRFNGVDRVISLIGYIDSNVVPCCAVCNYAKNDMEYTRFLGWINGLVRFHNTGNFIPRTENL